MMTNANSLAARAFGAVVLAGGVAAGGASAQAQETPRTADGHPDLQGVWVNGGVNLASGADTLDFRGRGGSFVGFEADGALRRTVNDNVPLYKPEYWDQITENDYMGNWDDPVDSCFPLGVPRQGAPHQIVKVEGIPAYVLMNQAGFNGYNGSYQSWDVHRWVWADGREHNAEYVAYESAMGDPVAHWEGDTLVIEFDRFHRRDLVAQERLDPRLRHEGHRTADARRRPAHLAGDG